MRRPEQAIRMEIKRLLTQLGFAIWDMEQNRPTRQTPGFADLFVLGHGMAFTVEVKTPKGKLSPAQVFFGTEATANGFTHLVWRSVNDAWDWLVEREVIEEAGA